MSNIEINYKITTDHTLLDKQNAITPELKPKLERFHQLALEGKKSSVKKILDAIEQYPDNPQLKNYLSGLYGELNEIEKMHDTNKWIIEKHPDYLFGKLNLANEYYLNQEYDKMPDVLGDVMELKELYPDRDTFHLNEVLSFYKCTILYFLAIGDFEEAETRYDIMLELAPDADVTEFATQQILLARMKLASQRFEEEEKSKITVETSSQEITTKSKAPHFNHKEIEWLYSNGLYIGEDKLNKILSLPKDTLVQDLELVLQDSIDRYTYFDELVYENGWDEETMNFVVHAIFLLGELQAEDSLDVVFNMLSQSDDYIELYFEDFISILWEPLYKIAFNRLKDCKQFMFKPGINTYSRINFIDVVEQFALHHPERRSEALDWYADLIQFYLNSSLDDNVIDSDLIGLLVCSLIDIKGSELLPDIEKLFEQGNVSKGICGDWNEVKDAFERPEKHDKKREILPIAERYKEITSTWAWYNEEYSSSDFDDDDFDDGGYLNLSETYQRAEPKIGRNDPCPCGSGKKYKKCCLNK